MESQYSTQSIEEEIEHSKIHWSQLLESQLDVDDVAEVSNVEVFKVLQSHPKWGTFFKTFSEVGTDELVMGQKFAQGGQAELYDVEIKWNELWRNEEDLRVQRKWALKVFRKGTFLRQLQGQWPFGMLQDHVDDVEWESLGNLPKFKFCAMHLGILLEDGRFAFLMVKEHGDLRHYMDRRMLTTEWNHCPFSNQMWKELCMKWLQEWHGCIAMALFIETSKPPMCFVVVDKMIGRVVWQILSAPLELLEQVSLGHLKYCKQSRIEMSIVSLNCLQKNVMSTAMGCCAMKS